MDLGVSLKGPKETFSREILKAKKTNKKMLNIINHQKNANKNHDDVLFHTMSPRPAGEAPGRLCQAGSGCRWTGVVGAWASARREHRGS